MALVILAYYGMLLHHLASSYWWLKNWGVEIIDTIFIMLDQRWKPGVLWALQKVHTNVVT